MSYYDPSQGISHGQISVVQLEFDGVLVFVQDLDLRALS